jgi:hypothetical protein
MSNYPPGVSDSTYGAPWNDIEIDKTVIITLKVNIITSFQSFQGPDKIETEQILNSIKSIIKEDLKNTSEDYEIIDIELIK